MANFIKVSEFVYTGANADNKPTGVDIRTVCVETDTGNTYATVNGTAWILAILTPTVANLATVTAKTNNLPATPSDEATLTAIKGGGWTNQTLVAMSAKLDTIITQTAP